MLIPPFHPVEYSNFMIVFCVIIVKRILNNNSWNEHFDIHSTSYEFSDHTHKINTPFLNIFIFIILKSNPLSSWISKLHRSKIIFNIEMAKSLYITIHTMIHFRVLKSFLVKYISIWAIFTTVDRKTYKCE